MPTARLGAHGKAHKSSATLGKISGGKSALHKQFSQKGHKHAGVGRGHIKGLPDEIETEDPLRYKAWEYMHSSCFEIFLLLVMLSNVFFVLAETDSVSLDSPTPGWMQAASVLFVIAYSIEVLARIYVWRTLFFMADPWNTLDVILISLDILFMILYDLDVVRRTPMLSMVRFFRHIRLLRAGRIMEMFPELHLICKSIFYAMKSMLWGVLTLGMLLTMWAVVGVHAIQPFVEETARMGLYDDCERCPRAFKSVLQANLTFFQTLVAGDSWGQVAIPLVETYPWTMTYFIAVLVSAQLGVMNLILAVIVERAQEARQESLHEVAAAKQAEMERMTAELIEMCKLMDKDGGGDLTADELLAGWDDNEAFRDLLRVMDFEKDDLDVIFNMLDQDGSGRINYTEFAYELQRIKSENPHTMLIFIKYYMTEVRNNQTRLICDLQENFAAIEENHRSIEENHAILLGEARKPLSAHTTPMRRSRTQSMSAKSTLAQEGTSASTTDASLSISRAQGTEAQNISTTCERTAVSAEAPPVLAAEATATPRSTQVDLQKITALSEEILNSLKEITNRCSEGMPSLSPVPFPFPETKLLTDMDAPVWEGGSRPSPSRDRGRAPRGPAGFRVETGASEATMPFELSFMPMPVGRSVAQVQEDIQPEPPPLQATTQATGAGGALKTCCGLSRSPSVILQRV